MHDSDNYLAWLSGNSLTTASSCAETSAQWTISYGDSAVYFANVATPSRILYFNSGANLFRCYTAAQSPISLYRGEGGSTTTYTTLDGTVADDCTNGHDWGEWVETKAATCTEQGEETRTCGRCGETETRKTDALGHDWDKGTVTKEATETETGEKTYTCLRCGETKTEELPKTECPSAKFTDVDTSKWYHEGVDFAVSNGYIRGITDTTFEPNTPMNRGMLVTILYRVAGEPDVADTSIPFTDVAEGRYFTNAVKWAYSNNIVTGVTEKTFEPQTPVTREQLATILYRYAGAEEVAEDLLKDFPDSASVHKYAQKAMNWAVSAGLITGNKADGVVYLDPAGSATRAQIAVILMRYLTTVA